MTTDFFRSCYLGVWGCGGVGVWGCGGVGVWGCATGTSRINLVLYGTS
jgi:hypothetical protein